MALVRGDTLFARPHSQVLAWAGWGGDKTGGGLWGWRSLTDQPAQAASNLTKIDDVERPPYNIFCAGHAALASGDLLVVSGTERGKTGEKQSARFNFATRRWTAAQMQSGRWYANATMIGQLPLPGGGVAYGRMLATAGYRYDHMVTFGGHRVNDGVWVNDVERYAITKVGHWDAALTDPTPAVPGPDWPEQRESHTLADQINGPHYLFGGKGNSGFLHDVWQLTIDDSDAKESYVWVQLSPNNEVPSLNRWRHSAVVATPNIDNPLQAKSPMYVFGGERASGRLGDLWRLHWRSLQQDWRWTDLTDSMTAADPLQIPTARSGHSAFWDKKNERMILYGGQEASGAITDPNVYVLRFPNNVPTWKVAKPKASSRVPFARTRHAMAADLTTSTTANGILFGGLTASGLSDSLWEFYVDVQDSVTWVSWPPNNSTPPAARAGASIILYETHPRSFVVVGGELAGGVADSTVWEFMRDTNKWSQRPSQARALTGHTALREHRIITELEPEIYDPDNNSWSWFGGKKKRQSYHTILQASDGKLYSTGPNQWGSDVTWRFTPASGAWTQYASITSPPLLDDTVNGILYRPDQIMKCGGSTANSFHGTTFSLPTGAPSTAQWRASVDTMALPRVDHVLNMLPTGEVIATGGTKSPNSNDPNPEAGTPRKRPEIWAPTYEDPNQPGKVGTWYGAVANDTLAAEAVTRGHHSSAVILPDGRILSGGGWDPHPSTVMQTVSQYSPPYLFKTSGAATRPVLLGAQDRITWNPSIPADTSLDFEVACADSVIEACLIRPGATTHAFNQDCRYVPLQLVYQVGHQVKLRLAGDASYAPPGNYLLFVLKDDEGRKVPSIARWVNVGAVKSNHATWDIVPPAAINDLVVTGYTSTSHTLQWTAPASNVGETTGRVTRYEIRYRSAGQMPTLEDFFTYGTSVAAPVPLVAGQVHTFTVNHPPAGQVLYFRIISRDAAGHDRNWSALSNEAQTPNGGNGGCPFVDTRTAGGWEVENSILGRSLTGSLSLDGYRLRHSPEVIGDRVHLRIRENEQELTTLDQVRLIAVDHEPGVRAYAVGEDVLLGTPSPASRAMTSTGLDVTSLFSGGIDGFRGGPGDTVVVEFGHEASAVIGEEQSTTHHDPFHMDDGGKCPPDCGYPLRAADPYSATAIDAQVLANSGIQLQTQDGFGGWRTVMTRYPREHPDEAILDGMGHGPVRLVFIGRHTVRAAGRLAARSTNFTARKLPLLAARHTRFGDVAAVVDTTGNLTSQLAPGDTVKLEFGWIPVPEGQVRELFLLSRGVYTAALPAILSEALPARFAVRGFQPNPFAASATLRLDLPSGSRVRLEVFDPQGRRVRLVSDAFYPPGSHGIVWDGRNEAGVSAGAGVYFYRLTAGADRSQGRFVRVP